MLLYKDNKCHRRRVVIRHLPSLPVEVLALHLLSPPETCPFSILFPSVWCVQAGITAAPARAVSAVKNMNIPQQIKDMKLPDLPQAIKDLKF